MSANSAVGMASSFSRRRVISRSNTAENARNLVTGSLSKRSWRYKTSSGSVLSILMYAEWFSFQIAKSNGPEHGTEKVSFSASIFFVKFATSSPSPFMSFPLNGKIHGFCVPKPFWVTVISAVSASALYTAEAETVGYPVCFSQRSAINEKSDFPTSSIA